MTVRSKAELKALFEKGDQPKAQDFVDLIDSLLSANGEDWPDPLPASSGKNLIEIAKEQVPNPWAVVAGTTGFIDSRNVVKSGDRTDDFPVGVRVRMTLATGYVYDDVTACSYDGGTNATTISLFDGVADLTISDIQPSIFVPVANGGPITIGATVPSQDVGRAAIGLPQLVFAGDRAGPFSSAGAVNGTRYYGPAADVTLLTDEVIWSHAGPTSKTTAAWAVGSGNGSCVDGGACLSNTWYYGWAVKRPDTGVVDFVLTTTDPSLLPTVPFGTLPAAYTVFARMGWVKTDGAGNLVVFNQASRAGTPWFYLGASVLDVSVTNPGTSEISAALSVPPGALAIVNVSVSSPSIQSFLNIGSPLYALDAPALNACNLAVASGGVAAGQFFVFTNSNREMKYRLSASNASLVVNIRTLGWINPSWVNI